MPDFEVTRAAERDAEDFTALIAAYPYKAYQQKAQGIERARLVEHLAEAVRAELSDPNTAAWIVRGAGRPLAAATLAPNEWHSGFYNLRMARCPTFLSFEQPRELTPLLCEAILGEARARGYQHLSARIDGDEYDNLRALEDWGFRPIDCSLKLGATILAESPIAPADARVRRYKPADRDDVIRIAGSFHNKNHFYNDDALSRAATDALFRSWTERSLDRLASHIFVVENGDGRVAGFVTYLVNRPLNERLGMRLAVLDYICLDPEAQGRSLGLALTGQSLADLSGEFDQVELRTSHNNYPALACYMKYGFRVLCSDWVLHRSVE
ncbi:MAG: GNAT family N-acetyltransferase [Candidatus Sumerlaeota bacterium]|nr:GNAT family N-acetyltransferase [Candidatus Sumerlaeota bacterium]